MDLWAWKHGVMMVFSRLGKPTDNVIADAFNRRVRAEPLSANWFLGLADAGAKCEAWRKDYNTLRPRGALGWKTPMEQAQALLGTLPRRRAKEPARFSLRRATRLEAPFGPSTWERHVFFS